VETKDKYSDAATYNVAMTTPSSAPRNFSFWLILAAAIAAACGLWLSGRLLGGSAAPKLENAVMYPQPRAIPEFHLAQANGQALTIDQWRGHWNVIYFGYASCPDVCPTTLATFKQVWKDLAQRQLTQQVQIDFISVDPERDTPEKLAKYVGFFSTDFIAATGNDDELTRLTRALGLMYSRDKDANGAIEVDHSGSAVIIDPQARLVGIFRPPFAATAVASDLTTLIASGH
jgi:protein SCO1